jgi:hypothetical protein
MLTSKMILAFIIGVATLPVILGASAWAKSLNLQMKWWKWTLLAVWYILLIFFIFLDFTFIGEGEVSAGWKMLLFQMVIMIILGVGLGRLLWHGRLKSS